MNLLLSLNRTEERMEILLEFHVMIVIVIEIEVEGKGVSHVLILHMVSNAKTSSRGLFLGSESGWIPCVAVPFFSVRRRAPLSILKITHPYHFSHFHPLVGARLCGSYGSASGNRRSNVSQVPGALVRNSHKKHNLRCGESNNTRIASRCRRAGSRIATPFAVLLFLSPFQGGL